MNIDNINTIWENTNVLLKSFNIYNLEQIISKSAIEHVKIQIQELVAKEQQEKDVRLEQEAIEQEAREKEAREQEAREQEAREQEARENVRLEQETIEKERLEKERLEKERLEQEEQEEQEEHEMLQQERLDQEMLEKEEQEQAVINKIQTLAVKAVIDKLNLGLTKNFANMFTDNIIDNTLKNIENNTALINIIKNTAINAVNTKIEEAKSLEEIPEQIEEVSEETKNLAKQVIIELIKKHNLLIQTIIAIKNAAIKGVANAIAPKDIIPPPLSDGVKIKTLDEELLELMDDFEENNILLNNATSNEDIENAKTKLLETDTNIKEIIDSPNIPDTDKDNTINALNKLLEAYQNEKNESIVKEQKYLDTIELLKKTILQKELEKYAEKEVLSKIPPPVAEPKNDVEPLMKNVAINKVTDTVKDEMINAALESKNDYMSMNIENDLKNAALTALYRALLGVPKKPIDITKPPTKYDIKITDKTYEYNEKGERKEIPELTKYDSILAK